ncbi:MAG: flagellar assembly peptidoglycan hydrolase FlgJ [Methylococcales bacterium]
MLSTQNADVYTDFNGLAKLKTQAKQASPAALKEVAKQFESIFVNNVLKSMREAKLADGAMDNDQSKFYTDMYDQQLAVHLSGKPGVGLADLIVKQLGGKQKTDDTEKMQADDYLNRSVGSGKNTAVNNHAAAQLQAIAQGVERVQPFSRITEDGVTISSFVDDRTPARTLTEIPFKSAATQPITSAQEFVKQLQPYAEQAAKELGVDPKALLAQAALESGWGRSLIKNANGSNSYNLFNIKAGRSWQGKQAQVSTLEFEQGVAKKTQAGFRSYSSFAESFQDYVAFIKSNPRYGEALKQVGNAENYLHKLQQAGYATDPNYAAKVIKIYNGNTLASIEPDVVTALND